MQFANAKGEDFHCTRFSDLHWPSPINNDHSLTYRLFNIKRGHYTTSLNSLRNKLDKYFLLSIEFYTIRLNPKLLVNTISPGLAEIHAPVGSQDVMSKTMYYPFRQ